MIDVTTCSVLPSKKPHICNYAQVCVDMKVITGLYVNLVAWCNVATPLIFTAEKKRIWHSEANRRRTSR